MNRRTRDRIKTGGGLTDGLSELMSSFGEAIDGLAELAEGKAFECKYKCEKDKKTVPRPGHIPTSNGCGSFGIEFDTAKLPEMTSCCDVHDKCYDTCNTDKGHCDKEFKDCLLKMCDSMQSTLNVEEYEGCQATAEIMYRGTMALGCTPFKNAQKKACTCGDEMALEDKSTSKNHSGSKSNTQEDSGTSDRNKSKKNVKNIKQAQKEQVKSNNVKNTNTEEDTIKPKDNTLKNEKHNTGRRSGEL